MDCAVLGALPEQDTDPDHQGHGAERCQPQIGDSDRGAYLTWLAYYAGVIEPIVNLLSILPVIE